MGAAGDMLMAALLEICPDREAFLKKMNELGLPGVQVSRFSATKCGIKGTGISVKINGVEEGEEHTDHHHSHEHAHSHGDHEHSHSHEEHAHTHGDNKHSHSHKAHSHTHEETHTHHHDYEPEYHHHAGMNEIQSIIGKLPVSEYVKSNALAVYGIIAEAESYVHGVPVDKIHFHEVGNLDAIADIIGVCILVEMINAQKIIVSPVHVGSGHVKAAHGILPVPAPATAYILKGIPFYSGNIRGELLTPTGAALLKHFADSFSPMPVMEVASIGYGMGKKDFDAANCVRVYLGETDNEGELNDTIAELNCNLDDMMPEAIGYATKLLMDNGALDVFTIPIYMKKNRPGCLLVCLCGQERAKEMAVMMLKHTTTNGVRITEHSRYKLKPEISFAETEFGRVRIKTSSGYGVVKVKPEYEDVAECAKKNGVSFEKVRQAALGKIRDN
jgi:uncharacterized protein (TIGR00299 family) protein